MLIRAIPGASPAPAPPRAVRDGGRPYPRMRAASSTTPACRLGRRAAGWDRVGMRHPASHASDLTAAGARARLQLLLAERRQAFEAGLEGNAVFMRDLQEDIDTARAAYVGIAVTEIATLRGELGGRNAG